MTMHSTPTAATAPAKKNHLKRAGLASVAVVTGALILGSAGSLSGWSDSKTIDAGTVQTGSMTLETGTGKWVDASDGVAFNTNTDAISPGDTLRYTQTVTIEANGKNLKGELTVGTLNAVPAALAGDVTVTTTLMPTDGLIVTGDTASFDKPGSYEVPVTITVAYEKGTEGSTDATTMGKEIDLTALTLSLNQIR